MQRLVLAVLLLAVLVGLLAVVALGVRAAVRSGSDAAERGKFGVVTVRKLAFAALIVLIAGASVGLLGGL